jgi:PAS domain S-box-containing protein
MTGRTAAEPIGRGNGSSHAPGQPDFLRKTPEELFMNTSLKRKIWIGFGLYLTLFFFMVLLLFVNLTVNASDILALIGAALFVLVILFFSYRWTIKDIQQRQESECRLRESEERYRDLLENASDLIQSVAPDGKYLYVNQAWLKVLGYTEAELKDLSMFDIIHPDSKTHYQQVFKDLLAGKICGLVEAAFVTRSGRTIMVEGTVNCHVENGKPTATRAIFRDVTKRKTAERAMLESEKRYRDLVDQSQALICIHDLEGNLLSVNPAAANMLGYEKEELIGRNMRSLLHPSIKYLWAAYLKRIQSEKSATGYLSVLTKKGEPRTWVYSNSLYEEAGKSPYVVGHAQDVTEFKEAESLNHRLKSIIETTSDFVGTATPEGRMFYCNAALRNALGLNDEKDLTQRHISEFHDQEYSNLILKEAIPQARQQGVWNGESVFRGADGQEIPVSQVIIAHKSLSGEVGFISMVARNITQQKALENRLYAQDAITRLLAKSASPSAAMPEILETICKTLNWEVGEFWRLDRETNTMVCDVLFRQAKNHQETVADSALSMKLSSTVDLPGRVLASGKPLWIDDLTQVLSFERAPRSEETGLRNAFAFPIFLGELPLGVIAFFGNQVRKPDFELLDLMTSIGSQIGQFIERKRAEEAVRESEARKSAILESALDCIITIDHEGRITEFNPAAEKTFGYCRQQIIGKALADLIAPHSMTFEQRLLIDPYFAAGDARAQGKRIEITALRFDRTEFPCDLAIAPIETDGTPMFTAFLRDLSEPKRSEKALQQSNHLLKALTRAQTEFIGESRRKVSFGDLLEDLLPLTNSEYGFIGEVLVTASGKPFVKSIALSNIAWDHKTRELYEKYSAVGVELRNLKALFDEALVSGKPVIANSPRPHALQGALELKTSLCLPIYFGEEMVGMIGLANRPEGYDTTLLEFLQPFASACSSLIQAYRTEQKRKQAEAEVAKLSLVASKTDNAVLITNHRGFVEWVNDAFVRLTGYALKEIQGKNPRKILPGPETDPATLGRISRSLAAKINFTEEVLHYRKNGQPYWVSMNVTPVLKENGDVLRYIAVQTDITERKYKQEELRHAKEAAEAASIAKSQFLAVMSHEIRTPLNAIIGMTDLALHTRMTPEQYDFLRTVQSNSEALLYLINDILDFSKIEAGQMDIERVAFNPAVIVEEVAELLSVRAGSKCIELICEISKEMPSRVMGDPNRFRQIVLNLAGNAIKFTEEGEVVIHLEAAYSDDGERADLHCYVTDTGIGIADHNREKIFEKFYQADASTTRKYGGSGLGLSISKLLAEMMKGRMWFDSEIGKGSTFHCRIPFAVVERASQSDETAIGQGYRALLVDDNQNSLRNLTRMAEEVGLLVDCAQNPHQALNILQDESADYDLIFLDKFLPGMDGLELARIIRQSPKYSASKLILMSPLGIEDAERLAQVNISEPLSKPIIQKRLRQTLERALHPQTIQAQQEPLTETLEALSPAGQKPICILVVEDNPDNQKLARTILESAGYTVDIAENGEIAVQRTRDYLYDLILMDVQMPLMDGLEATEAIRRMERQQGMGRVPIIALTAHAIEGYRDRCIECGMDDYLSKPIKREWLLETVGNWVDQRPVVLIVDDSAPSQMLIKNYLKDAGYQLFFAHNGRQGLDFLSRHWVSLILLDMEMPVLDGYATARAIRRMTGFQDLPIIAMTGHDGVEEKHKCLASGCSDYIAKPLRKPKVLEVIGKTLIRTRAEVAEMEKEKKPEQVVAYKAVPPAGERVLVTVDEDIADLVPDFLEGRRGDVQRIKEMLQAQNFSVLYTLGHDMKGCGMGYGFAEISRIGKAIEAAAREENAPEILLWNDKLEHYLDVVQVITSGQEALA